MTGEGAQAQGAEASRCPELQAQRGAWRATAWSAAPGRLPPPPFRGAGQGRARLRGDTRGAGQLRGSAVSHRLGGHSEDTGERPGCTGVCWLDSHLATQDRPPPQDGWPHFKRSSRHVHLEAGLAVRTWTPLGRRPCAVPTSLSPNIRRDMETLQRPSETMHQASVRPTKAQRGGDTTGRPGKTLSTGAEPQVPGQQSPQLPGRLCVPPVLTVFRDWRAACLPPHPSPGRPTTVSGTACPPRPTPSGRILRAPQQFHQGPGRPAVMMQILGEHPGHLEVAASARGLIQGLVTSCGVDASSDKGARHQAGSCRRLPWPLTGCRRGRAGSARLGRWSWRSAR